MFLNIVIFFFQMGDLIREGFQKVREDFEKKDRELSDIRNELNSLKNQFNEILPSLLETNKQILGRLEAMEISLQKRDPLREHVIKKFPKRRKQVVLNKILELVARKESTLTELKAVMVDELNYCSRASFYRYVDYLKKLNRVEIVSINNIDLIKILSQNLSH